MSTNSVCFYGELTKIILELSSNTLLICSTESANVEELTEWISSLYHKAFDHSMYQMTIVIAILTMNTKILYSFGTSVNIKYVFELSSLL